MPPVFSKRVRADLALGFCALIWGSTFVVVKDALADVSVFVYVAIRFGLSAFVMAVLYWRSVRALRWPTVWAGVQIGLFMLGGYVFQTVGLRYTSPSRAAFITGSSVVLVPIILAAFGRRRIGRWIWMGAAPSQSVGPFTSSPMPKEGLGALNHGDPLVFVCSVMFALHMIFIGRHVERHSVGSLAFLQVRDHTAVVSALLLPVFAATGWEPPRLTWTGRLVFAVLITSIGSTVIAFSLQVSGAAAYVAKPHGAPGQPPSPFSLGASPLAAGWRAPRRKNASAVALILVAILLLGADGPRTRGC